MQAAMSQLQSFMNSSRASLERLARQRERAAAAPAPAPAPEEAAAADGAPFDDDGDAGPSPGGGVDPPSDGGPPSAARGVGGSVRISTGSVLPVADSNAAAADAARSAPDGPAVVTPSSAPGLCARHRTADPTTLEGALVLHSSYLCSSDADAVDVDEALPLAYASWLRNAVGLESVQGLVDALDCCSDLLTAGDGTVGILPGLAGRFRDSLAEGMFDEYSLDGYGSAGSEGGGEEEQVEVAPDGDGGAVVDWHGRAAVPLAAALGGMAPAADPPEVDSTASGGAEEEGEESLHFEEYDAAYDDGTPPRAAEEGPPAYCYYRDQSAPRPHPPASTSLQSASAGALPSFLPDRPDPPSLDGVVDEHAHLLAGPASSYSAWLRDEMDIETLSDLAEAVDDPECLEVLSAGDGMGAALLAGCGGRFAEAVRFAAGRPVGDGSDDARRRHVEATPVRTFPQSQVQAADADVTTLGGIVARHAHFLTGPAASYETFLRNEMDISSPR